MNGYLLFKVILVFKLIFSCFRVLDASFKGYPVKILKISNFLKRFKVRITLLPGLNPSPTTPWKWLWVTELAYCDFDTFFTSILGFSDLSNNFDLRSKGYKLCKLLIAALISCLLWCFLPFVIFFYFDIVTLILVLIL